MIYRMRFLLPAFLFLTLPARALDVVFHDRTAGKDITVKNAEIDEGTEGVVLKRGTPPTGLKLTFPLKVSGMDVRDMQWAEKDVEPTVAFLAYRKPFARVDRAALPATKEADRVQLMKESLPDFKELIKGLPPGSKLKRHVEFRHAETVWRLALVDDSFREQASKLLEKFAQDYPTSWQITPGLMKLAQLQEDQGDLQGMQKTYETLAAIPGLSDEIRTTSLINAARVLMKTENFAGAQGKLNDLKGRLRPEDPLTGKVDLYLAQCELLGSDAPRAQKAEKQLREFLEKTDDKSLKALAHNTLGDYYVKLKRDEEAFWEYLRVDILYNDDRFEHARAMYHLIRLFREVKKDADRSEHYAETLTKDKRFAGMEYQKKAMKK